MDFIGGAGLGQKRTLSYQCPWELHSVSVSLLIPEEPCTPLSGWGNWLTGCNLFERRGPAGIGVGMLHPQPSPVFSLSQAIAFRFCSYFMFSLQPESGMWGVKTDEKKKEKALAKCWQRMSYTAIRDRIWQCLRIIRISYQMSHKSFRL